MKATVELYSGFQSKKPTDTIKLEAESLPVLVVFLKRKYSNYKRVKVYQSLTKMWEYDSIYIPQGRYYSK